MPIFDINELDENEPASLVVTSRFTHAVKGFVTKFHF